MLLVGDLYNDQVNGKSELCFNRVIVQSFAKTRSKIIPQTSHAKNIPQAADE